MKKYIKHSYGYKKDKKDKRDFAFSPRIDLSSLPESINLKDKMPSIFNQGKISSCVANACSSAFKYSMNKQNNICDFIPARLFIYYNAREIIDCVAEDSGCQIRDGIKVMAKLGVCSEDQWKYEEDKYSIKPNEDCYKEGLEHQVLSYHRLDQDINILKSCLVEGYPFVFGMIVYTYMESEEMAKTGILKMPQRNDRILGKHALICHGYDKESFLITNSWGEKWGNNGTFIMPYDYITNKKLSADFWTLRLIEDEDAPKL